MTYIQLLPKDLANVIAAGEVIERPASLVKELVENSLDAKATRIEIYCKEGGFNSIRVSDNGQGIFHEELELAVAAHATSKIYNLEDLLAIKTLGFRGEALASIAAVSRLQISSKPASQSQAWQIKVIEKNNFEKNPTAHPNGTTIIVEDLFYNIPVRRKFLHSTRSEQLQIDKMIKSLILSHFNLHFIYYVDDKLIWNCPPATNEKLQIQRITKLLGKRYLEAAKMIECVHQDFNLRGWFIDANYHSSQNDGQLFYVNNRFVKDKLLYHAVKTAYADYLPVGRYPFYCLYLECDPSVVDVNVHPTKHEVRFIEARWVHDFIKSSVARALNENNEGEISANFISEQNINFKNADLNFTTLAIPSASEKNLTINPQVPKEAFLIWVTLLEKQYIIAKKINDIFIIDGVKAHHFQKLQYLHSLSEKNDLVKINLLLPYICILDMEVIENLLTVNDKFQKAGIELTRLSHDTIAVRKIPQVCEQLNIRNFMDEVSALFKNKNNLSFTMLLKLLTIHEDIQLEKFSDIQKQDLLEYVNKNPDPSYCRLFNIGEWFKN